MGKVYFGIQDLSVGSLYIEMYRDEIKLMSGTGFVAKNKKGYFLITNLHNFTGVSPSDKKLIAKGFPNKIKVYHHTFDRQNSPAKWRATTQNLFKNHEESEELWIKHPEWKEKVDFAALKINDEDDLAFLLMGFNQEAEEIILAPSDKISVIGFPFGISAGMDESQYIAIWNSGYIASEPLVDYQGLPKFLIDCRTRPGNSGSPVYYIEHTGRFNNNNDLNEYNRLTKKFDRAEFLGIYSGRINRDSDIGIVWKASAILELLEYIEKSELF